MYLRLNSVENAWPTLPETEDKEIYTDREFASTIFVVPGMTVLDVGAGWCRDGGFLTSKGAIVTSFDKVLRSGVNIVGNAIQLPFEDNSFDLVFSNQLLSELTESEAEQALSEMRRVGKSIAYTELDENFQFYRLYA